VDKRTLEFSTPFGFEKNISTFADTEREKMTNHSRTYYYFYYYFGDNPCGKAMV